MNLADLIALLILVLLALWGSKKGFVRSVFGFSSLILSLVLALTLYPVVTDFLSDSVVGEYVRLNVYKVFDATQEEPTYDTEPDKILKLPASLAPALSETINEATESVKDSIAHNAAQLALKLLGMLVVFLLVKLILWVLLHLFEGIAKLPVLRSLNKLLGGVIGVLYGFLIIYLLLALLTFTTTLQTFNKPIELVLESKYVSSMYHDNILLNFLNGN